MSTFRTKFTLRMEIKYSIIHQVLKAFQFQQSHLYYYL